MIRENRDAARGLLILEGLDLVGHRPRVAARIDDEEKGLVLFYRSHTRSEMLDFPDSPNYASDQPPELRSPAVSLAEAAAFIRRHLSIILLTFLTAIGVALLYLIVAVPQFTAEVELVIESRGTLADAASVSTIVESQIGIIRSGSLARAVIRKLDLTKTPEFLGETGGVRSTIRSIARSLGCKPETEETETGGVRSTIRSIARSLGWCKPETEETAMRLALETFQRKLSVTRVGVTYIVGMSFQSIDPERAELILNTVAETYIAQQMDAAYGSNLLVETWIQDRLNELSNQASAAQKALADYQNRNPVPSSAGAVAGAARSQSTEQMQGKLRELMVAAVESSTSALDNFRHALRLMEAKQQQSAPVVEARLISAALPPFRPSSPRRGIVLAISTVAGLLLGIAIAILRDLSDRSVRSSERLWRELQIACIATVPRVMSSGAWRRSTTVFSGLAEKLAMKWARVGSLGRSMRRSGPASVATPSTDREIARYIVRTESPIWTIPEAPRSRFTESFLEIKLAIDLVNRRGRRNQVIGITSTEPDEGKSTVAASLALLMAHAGAHVILVDCNLRNRSLSATLAPAAGFGILEVMTGAASVSETMWSDPISRLAFLPIGSNSRIIYTSDVLASEKLVNLFQTLRGAYEYVIVDLPPVAPFADVRAAAHLLDSFIFVIEWGRTNIGVVERALEVFSDMDEILLGVTLNKAI